MKKRNLQFILIVTCVVLLVGIFGYIKNHATIPNEIVTPIVNTLEQIGIHQDADKKKATLKDVVNESLSGTRGTYSIVIKNLQTGEEYRQNGNLSFDSASLYKLWVMATAYDQIQNGDLNEYDTLHQDISVLNEKFMIATEDAEKTEGEITLSVSDALHQMIAFSDNYAALLLSEKVRLSNVSKFLSAHGFDTSKIGPAGGFPTVTASDIALFFERLSKGTLINADYDEKMLDILKDQMLNNKIPKNLPKDVVIAHKTGELDRVSHDAGIVYTPKGDYLIVILSESNAPLAANDRIAGLSEAVYQYFQK